jgi:predicted N-acetyltransferase YhbS
MRSLQAVLNPKFKIQVATMLDFAEIGRLLRLFQEELGEKVDELKMVHMMKYALKAISSGNPIVLIAVGEHKGKRVIYGIVVFDIREHPYGDVVAWGEHLYVLPQCRNGEIAQALIQTGEQLAAELGAKEIYFDTKIPAYFERAGYKKDETRMKKVIS